LRRLVKAGCPAGLESALNLEFYVFTAGNQLRRNAGAFERYRCATFGRWKSMPWRIRSFASVIKIAPSTPERIER
jgi:hypothetical protein